MLQITPLSILWFKSKRLGAVLSLYPASCGNSKTRSSFRNRLVKHTQYIVFKEKTKQTANRLDFLYLFNVFLNKKIAPSPCKANDHSTRSKITYRGSEQEIFLNRFILKPIDGLFFKLEEYTDF